MGGDPLAGVDPPPLSLAGVASDPRRTFLTRLAGLIAFAVAFYFPSTSEEKLAGFITMALSWLSGKFEKQPAAAVEPTPIRVGQGGPSTPSGK